MPSHPPHPFVAAIDMGYGHLRAAAPLADALGVPLLLMDLPPLGDARDAWFWWRTRAFYEPLTRWSQVPALGAPLRGLLARITAIPDAGGHLSGPTAGTRWIERAARAGAAAPRILRRRSGSDPADGLPLASRPRRRAREVPAPAQSGRPTRSNRSWKARGGRRRGGDRAGGARRLSAAGDVRDRRGGRPGGHRSQAGARTGRSIAGPAAGAGARRWPPARRRAQAARRDRCAGAGGPFRGRGAGRARLPEVPAQLQRAARTDRRAVDKAERDDLLRRARVAGDRRSARGGPRGAQPALGGGAGRGPPAGRPGSRRRVAPPLDRGGDAGARCLERLPAPAGARAV